MEEVEPRIGAIPFILTLPFFVWALITTDLSANSYDLSPQMHNFYGFVAKVIFFIIYLAVARVMGSFPEPIGSGGLLYLSCVNLGTIWPFFLELPGMIFGFLLNVFF